MRGQLFWGFPLYRPALLGISTLTPGTFGDFHFGARHFWGFPLCRRLNGKRTLSNDSTAIENQTFGAGVTTHVKYNFMMRVF